MGDYYTYVLTVNSMPFYVGRGQGDRIKVHRWCAKKHPDCTHSACKFIRFIWEVGYDFEEQKIDENLDQEQANQAEKDLIKKGFDQGWNFVNKTDGGTGPNGYKWTQKQREQRAQFMLEDMKRDPERYNRFIYSHLGEKQSPELIEKRAKAIKEAWQDGPLRENQRQRMLNKWSDPDAKAKQKERFADPALRKKCGEANKGQTRKALTYHGFIAPDGTVYSPVHNLTLFCQEHGLQKSNMCLVDKGKQVAHKGWTKLPQ